MGVSNLFPIIIKQARRSEYDDEKHEFLTRSHEIHEVMKGKKGAWGLSPKAFASINIRVPA